MAAHLIYLKSCLWTIRAIRAKHSLANALLLLCPKCGKACTGQCSTLCVQFCVWRVVRGQICSVACSPRWACHTKCGLNRRRIFNCITFPVCTDSGFTQSSLHWRVVLKALNANTLHLVPDGCQLKAALFSLSHIYGTRSCNSWSNPHQERFAQWEWDQDLVRSTSRHWSWDQNFHKHRVKRGVQRFDHNPRSYSNMFRFVPIQITNLEHACENPDLTLIVDLTRSWSHSHHHDDHCANPSWSG